MGDQHMTEQKKPGPVSEEALALEGRLLKRIAEMEARLLKLEGFTPAKQLYTHEIKEIEGDEEAERSQ
jgi:hypothetical protein